MTFIERVSPALELVDSSSGAIGTVVNYALADLVPVIANAGLDMNVRDAWLERLFVSRSDAQESGRDALDLG